MLVKVFYVHVVATALGGTCTALDNPVYSGNPAGAVDTLKRLGPGYPVEVRVYNALGAWLWTRSCMNKPALWDALLSDDIAALGGAPRPLKPGQSHCPYCEGYGYRPRPRNDLFIPSSGPKAVRCDECDGTGYVVWTWRR